MHTLQTSLQPEVQIPVSTWYVNSRWNKVLYMYVVSIRFHNLWQLNWEAVDGNIEEKNINSDRSYRPCFPYVHRIPSANISSDKSLTAVIRFANSQEIRTQLSHCRFANVSEEICDQSTKAVNEYNENCPKPKRKMNTHSYKRSHFSEIPSRRTRVLIKTGLYSIVSIYPPFFTFVWTCFFNYGKWVVLMSKVSLMRLARLLVFVEFVAFDANTRWDISKRVIFVTRKSNIAV